MLLIFLPTGPLKVHCGLLCIKKLQQLMTGWLCPSQVYRGDGEPGGEGSRGVTHNRDPAGLSGA